jgi:hypothetical protein
MLRLVAEIENSSKGLSVNNCFTMVVLPAPEGAEKIISFPSGIL